MPLNPESLRPQLARILQAADLETISAKQVRKQLLAADPTLSADDVKAARDGIDVIISELFDSLRQDEAASSASSGTASRERSPVKREVEPEQFDSLPPPSSAPEPLAKKKAKKDKRSRSPSEGSNVKRENEGDAAGSKKERKRARETEDKDALLAAKLSEELNAHATRGTRIAGPAKQRSKVNGKPAKKDGKGKGKFKSQATVRDSDDSGASASSDSDASSSTSSSDEDTAPRPPKKKKQRTTSKNDGGGSGSVRGGAFNKEMWLSEPLSRLMNGETKLSRPQTVKRIWEYVKARNLQDPNDKRYIVCAGDELLTGVFKVDKIHMFTMNKSLSQHLKPMEE